MFWEECSRLVYLGCATLIRAVRVLPARRVSIVSAGVMALVTVASIVLIGNWLLAPAAIASIVAALLPERSRHSRVELVSARV